MQPQRNHDGDVYEPKTPLVRLGQGDYVKDYDEFDFDRGPTGAVAAYVLIAVVFFFAFVTGWMFGVYFGGVA